jgi:hypothetical protein
MSDRQQRTIDFLDDQLGHDEARWTALLAALDALVAEWREVAATPQNDDGYQQATLDAAASVTAVLAVHRGPRLCPDCDHGVAGGQPCATCGGSGYRP